MKIIHEHGCMLVRGFAGGGTDDAYGENLNASVHFSRTNGGGGFHPFVHHGKYEPVFFY